MGIDVLQARILAEQRLAHINAPELHLVLTDAPVEVPEGWFFFYDDRRHVATGDFDYRSPGTVRYS